MMDLNSFGGIWSEFRSVYSQESSLLRGFDAVALFAFLTVVLQGAYAAVSGGYPFPSLISSICASLGLFTLVIALRIHLTPSTNSKVTPERSFVDFLFSLTLLFWFVWTLMI
jgi:hypothetical protein